MHGCAARLFLSSKCASVSKRLRTIDLTINQERFNLLFIVFREILKFHSRTSPKVQSREVLIIKLPRQKIDEERLIQVDKQSLNQNILIAKCFTDLGKLNLLMVVRF